jgi:hypothetical protein
MSLLDLTMKQKTVMIIMLALMIGATEILVVFTTKKTVMITTNVHVIVAMKMKAVSMKKSKLIKEMPVILSGVIHRRVL